MPVRLSVVMPTYNGARFIAEQIESILQQQPRPDEFVVSDDGSTDDTVRIIHAEADRAGFEPMVLEAGHLGLRANIERALKRCTGYVVVLSDQDDIWRPGKLAAIAEAFEDSDVTMWISDADILHEDGAHAGFRLWDVVTLGPREQAALSSGHGLRRLLHGSTVTGATMAFRRNVLDLALPLPAELDGADPLYLHDGWIAIMASVTGTIVTDNRAFIGYRQHADQVTGMSIDEFRRWKADRPRVTRRSASNAQVLQTVHRRIALVAERVRSHATRVRPRDLALLHDLESLAAVRSRDFGANKVVGVVREWMRGSYGRHARGWRTAAADLVLRRR